MKNENKKRHTMEKKRWIHIYSVVLIAALILVCATTMWFRSTRQSSEKTVNDMVRFYLTEIAERNSGAILFELDKRVSQIQRVTDVLSQEDLRDEQCIRDFVETVQQISGLDLFALVDEQGMVYTEDSTFLGTTQFHFLSKPITQPRVDVENRDENSPMIIIASPITSPEGSEIPMVSCFTGLTIENLVSTMELNGTDNKTVCRLFSGDGVKLLNVSAEYPNSRNLFDVWEETARFAPGYSLDKIRQDWETGQSGYAVYSVEEAGNTYMYYRPIAHMGLYFTVAMRESNINAIVKAGTQRMLGYSIWYCLVVVALLCGILFMVIKLFRIERQNQLEKEQLKIVGALSSEYVDVFLADLEKDESTTIKSSGQMIAPEKRMTRSYREVWNYFVDRYVFKEDAEEVLNTIMPDRLSALMTGLSEYDLDFRLQREDGIHYCHAKYVRMETGEDRFIAGLRNNDAQVLAEQERQKILQDALTEAQHANRAKTTFLNNMSHDIRTPMNAIMGFTNIALKQQPNPEVKDCLDKISESSEHLLTMINDVLDISRIESGKIKYTPVPVDISTVTDVVLDITNGFLLNRDLTFKICRTKLETPYVLADPVRIREVLVNILSNAVKYTDDGGTICFETAYQVDADEKHLVMRYRISDTGVGMSEDFLGRIFDDFTQEENGARTQYKGTGLGMAITKQYVDMMGGTIVVESKKGVGSTFTVELPMEFTTKEAAVKQELPQRRERLNGVRVLIAEDNELNAEISMIQLEDLGMKVTRAVNGKQAVECFVGSPEGTFDVILMDIMMPFMNGYEATRAIRNLKERPDGKTIPIIALTANAFAEDVQNSLEAGMNGHLSKPIVIEEVVKTILCNLDR